VHGPDAARLNDDFDQAIRDPNTAQPVHAFDSTGSPSDPRGHSECMTALRSAFIIAGLGFWFLVILFLLARSAPSPVTAGLLAVVTERVLIGVLALSLVSLWRVHRFRGFEWRLIPIGDNVTVVFFCAGKSVGCRRACAQVIAARATTT